MSLIQLPLVGKQPFYFLATALVIVTLPMGIQINGIAVGLLVLSWLLAGKWREKWRLLKQNHFHLALILFYLLHVLALLYTEDNRLGLLEIEKKLPLLLLPLVLGSLPAFDNKSLNQLLKLFVLVCFTAVVYSIFKLVYLYFMESHSLATTNIQQALPLHYPYFGMYLSFAILISLHFVYSGLSRGRVSFSIGLVVLFTLFILFIGAKMAFVSWIFIYLTFLIVSRATDNKFSLKYFSGYALLLIVALSAIFIIPQSRVRFMDSLNQFELKMVSWKCSLEVFLNNSHIIVGAAPADVQGLMQLCYFNVNRWMFDYSYNAHNQFLETAAGLGILGLLLLLYVSIMPFFTRVRYRRLENYKLALMFLCLFILSSLTESTLQVNKGAVFFALFYSLLFNQQMESADKA